MSSNTFVGSKISLISKAGIRYEGTLVDINAAESTVSLDNVLSYGTEGRPAPQVFPPCKTPYAYVKFRGSDIADLHVYENPPKAAPAQPLQDPAIIEASQGSASPALASGQLSPGGPVGNSTFSNSFNSQAASSYSHSAYPHAAPSAPTPANSFEQSDANEVNASSASPAPASSEPSNDTAQQNGEGEGRASNYRGRGRNTERRNSYRRYREGMPYTNKTLKFEADFDFSAANAKFNKDDLEQEFNKKLGKLCLSESSNDPESDQIIDDAPPIEGEVIKRDEGEEDEEQCYDKEKSFFDSISCEALEKENGQRRRPNSWQVERSLNSETFGEGVISFQRRNYQGNYRGRGGSMNNGPPHNGYMNNYHNNNPRYNNNYRGRGGSGEHNNNYYRGGYRNYDNNNNGYRSNNNGYSNRDQNEGGQGGDRGGYRSGGYNNNRSEGGYDNRRGGGNNEGYSGGYNNRRDNNGQQQQQRQPRYNNYYERSNEDGPRHNYRRADRGSRTQTEAT